MTTDHADAPGLTAILEGLEQTVGLGEQLGMHAELVRARDVLAQTSHRRRLAPETTVAALLGATGSGKSSLTNALTSAGDECDLLHHESFRDAASPLIRSSMTSISGVSDQNDTTSEWTLTYPLSVRGKEEPDR